METYTRGLTQRLDMIKSLEQIQPLDRSKGQPDSAGATSEQSFGDFLMDRLKEVNDLNIAADQKIKATLKGEEPNPHSTMIALQKADISFRLLMSVQQRIVQAYQEIIRTPIG